jgi:hypothetical protein
VNSGTIDHLKVSRPIRDKGPGQPDDTLILSVATDENVPSIRKFVLQDRRFILNNHRAKIPVMELSKGPERSVRCANSGRRPGAASTNISTKIVVGCV